MTIYFMKILLFHLSQKLLSQGLRTHPVTSYSNPA
jgi:hypothetical protein